MRTPPPEESPDRLPSTPLPAAPRRQIPETLVQSPIDDFEEPTVPVEEQRGFSWLANYPRDPLRYVHPIFILNTHILPLPTARCVVITA